MFLYCGPVGQHHETLATNISSMTPACSKGDTHKPLCTLQPLFQHLKNSALLFMVVWNPCWGPSWPLFLQVVAAVGTCARELGKKHISERGPSGVPTFPARMAEEGSPVDKARALRLDIPESQLKDLKARLQPLEEDLHLGDRQGGWKERGRQRTQNRTGDKKTRAKRGQKLRLNKACERKVLRELGKRKRIRVRDALGFRERTAGTDLGDQKGGPAGVQHAPKFPLRRNREAGQGDLREKRKGQKVLVKERERTRSSLRRRRSSPGRTRSLEEGPGRSRERGDLQVDYERDSEREPPQQWDEVQEKEEGADNWSRLVDTPGYSQEDWSWSSWDWNYWDTWQPNCYLEGEGKKGKGKGKGQEKSKSKNEKGKKNKKLPRGEKTQEYKGTTQVTQSTRSVPRDRSPRERRDPSPSRRRNGDPWFKHVQAQIAATARTAEAVERLVAAQGQHCPEHCAKC